ncbi:thioredoxin domain-containing protein [Haloarcula sp. 1CSR25-25]|jgi:protein-disulfide isomerase|uniref:DsbA family protein n=1 Tax=Haloarcula sp. 1CSR25-25 TaxID=2862545 RepID=UPI0028953AAA|nr:thioredoxin domain-containing protein [Haloarcula sp. 1CSR25-25]MDT3437626.1 DsbA family protein [Haloarcula sp. 1CSR25-25]
MTDHACPICDAGFTSESSLDDHCWDAHGACHHCGTEFDDQNALYAHWLAVHGDSLSNKARARATAEVGELTFRDRLEYQGPASAVANASLSRRHLLYGGALGLGGVAGATLLSDSGGGGGKSLAEHPAATKLGAQPTLGPSPSEAEGTIVAFEDPSCPACARFERSTFPRLKSELIDPGRVSFVFRGIPVVYQWGDPAVLALEATHSRSVAAFWGLKTFYYREQANIGMENVQEVTRQYLADQTDVDAAAVISDVQNEMPRDVVDVDLQASQDAGVQGTPTFFLFSEGSFATKIVGPQSYDVFASSLGV